MTDVVVTGGGVSGVAAAIAAARAGASVILVERYGFCGGSLTNAGVGPMMTFHAGQTQVVQGIGEEIISRLKARGASPGHIEDSTAYASSVTPFDAEQLKAELDLMLEENGVRVLYHAFIASADVKNGRIEAVNVCTKQGIIPLQAKVYVDATGDGDLAYFSGAALKKGRDSDQLAQPMTTNMKVSQVDIEELKAYVRQCPGNFNIKEMAAMDRASRLSLAGFYKELNTAFAEGRLHFQRDCVLLFETNNPGEVIVNTTRVLALDATDPWQLSQAEIQGRKQANELFNFLKSDCRGFENAVFISTGVQIGVRESRRLAGEYILTADDLLNSVHFEDCIAKGGYPIDIHDPNGAETNTTHLKPGQSYEIPYRSLIPKELSNLLCAGRCISASHEACAAIRVAPIAMAIGQAAGCAAALSARGNKPCKEIDVKELQRVLAGQGAVIA